MKKLLIPLVIPVWLGAIILYICGYLFFFTEYEIGWHWLMVIFCGHLLLASFIGNIFAYDEIVRGKINPEAGYYLIGLSYGCIWWVSIPASIYFFVSAIFMGGSWYEFFYAFIVGKFMWATARAYMYSS